MLLFNSSHNTPIHTHTPTYRCTALLPLVRHLHAVIIIPDLEQIEFKE